jgi:GNAT superfamily N-acetyltransferase
MTVLHTSLIEQPTEEWRLAILKPLLAFNEAKAGPNNHQFLVIGLSDDDGGMHGGFWGVTAYGWLYTQLLSVPEDQRRQGLGRRLMLEAEAEAVRRGCRHAWVDTIFAPTEFYEKLGYQVFGTLPDYPAGFSMTFMKKDLLA